VLGIGAAEPSLSRTIYLIVAGALNGAMSCRNLLTQSRAFAGFPPDALANQWVPRWSFHCDLPPNRTYSTGSVAPEEVEMRIFIAGASGVLGRALTPVLISCGHTICGMFKDSSNIPLVESLGAKAAIADALDMEAVLQAVLQYRPEAIISQLTALGGPMDLFHFDRYFAQTNRLRTKGNDNLLAAARTFGVRKFVAQSFGGWPYRPVGSWVKSEGDSLNPSPPRQAAATLEAIRYLERKVTEASDLKAIALRYSGLYGPGTPIASKGEFVESVKTPVSFVLPGHCHLVIRTRTRCCDGNGSRRRERQGWYLQCVRRRTCAGKRVVACFGGHSGCETSA